MKICFIIPSYDRQGPISVVLNLVKEICSNNLFEVMVVCLRNYGDLDYKDSFIRFSKLGFFVVEDDNVGIQQLLDSVDIVHSHCYYPDKLLFKYRGNAKKITTIHCNFSEDYPKAYGYLKGWFGALQHYLFLKFGGFNRIVTCSQTLSLHYKKIMHNNVININNGVDQSIYKPISNSIKRIRRQELNLSEFDKIYIFSGRLIRRKKVPELINYFLEKCSSNDVLLILGGGEELQQCLDAANNSSNVILIGHVNNPEFYYQISDFILSNSTSEGYPMSILEAISCGCRALLSSIPAHLELIENNQNVAFPLEMLGASNDKSFYDISALSDCVMAKKYMELYVDLLK